MKRLKKIDLVKFKKQIDTFEPKHELFVLYTSILCCALGYDLKLDKLTQISSMIFLLELTWLLCWFVCFLVYAFLKKKQDTNNGGKNE